MLYSTCLGRWTGLVLREEFLVVGEWSRHASGPHLHFVKVSVSDVLHFIGFWLSSRLLPWRHVLHRTSIWFLLICYKSVLYEHMLLAATVYLSLLDCWYNCCFQLIQIMVFMSSLLHISLASFMKSSIFGLLLVEKVPESKCICLGIGVLRPAWLPCALSCRLRF